MIEITLHTSFTLAAKENKTEEEVLLMIAQQRFLTAFYKHQEAILVKSERELTKELEKDESERDTESDPSKVS